MCDLETMIVLFLLVFNFIPQRSHTHRPCRGHAQSEKYLWCSAGFDCNYIYGIMQGIIAVASVLATMALYGNGTDPQ